MVHVYKRLWLLHSPVHLCRGTPVAGAFLPSARVPKGGQGASPWVCPAAPGCPWAIPGSLPSLGRIWSLTTVLQTPGGLLCRALGQDWSAGSPDHTGLRSSTCVPRTTLLQDRLSPPPPTANRVSKSCTKEHALWRWASLLCTGGLFSLRWPVLSSSTPTFTDTFPRSAGTGGLGSVVPFLGAHDNGGVSQVISGPGRLLACTGDILAIKKSLCCTGHIWTCLDQASGACSPGCPVPAQGTVRGQGW